MDHEIMRGGGGNPNTKMSLLTPSTAAPFMSISIVRNVPSSYIRCMSIPHGWYLASREIFLVVNTAARSVLDADLAVDDLLDGVQNVGKVVEGDEGDILLLAP